MSADMGAEGLGEGLHVDPAIGMAGADFITDPVAERLDDGVVDTALGDDLDQSCMVGGRGAVEEELGGDGDGVEPAGIAGSGGEDGSGREEADLTGADPVQSERTAVIGDLQFVDAFEVDGEEVIDGTGGGDLDLTDAVLLDTGGRPSIGVRMEFGFLMEEWAAKPGGGVDQ